MRNARADHAPQALKPVGGRAGGVLVRGYVVAVHAPGEGPPVPDPIPGWLVDVHVTEPGWRGLLRWVPVATQSGGVYSTEHWQPYPMTKKLGGGSLTLEGGPTATPPHLADGDLVIVAFMGGDLQRPVVIAQLTHPGAPPAIDGYRWWRSFDGAVFAVTEGGGRVEATLPEGGSLVVTTGSGATITIQDDIVNVVRGRIVAQTEDVSLNVQPVLLEALLLDLGTLFTELLPLITLAAAIFGIPIPQTTAIIPLLAAGTVGSQSKPYKATSLESD
jgi:hypothetical protein